MKSSWFRLVSRLLIMSMLGFSFQSAFAGLVSTDQVAGASQSDRDKVASFLSRSEVASQMQAMGIQPQAAKDRVAAMTDEEVAKVAGKIDTLPAGAFSGWAIAAIIIVILAIIYWWPNWRK